VAAPLARGPGGILGLRCSRPLSVFSRCLQRYPPQGTRAKVVQHGLGRLLQVQAATAHDQTTLAGNQHQQFVGVDAGHGRAVRQFVAGGQRERITGLQPLQHRQCHFLFVIGVASHGAAGGQVQATLRHGDAWPQHAGGVVQRHVAGQRDDLFGLGDPGFVTCLGGLAFGQRVDERALAHVGNAADEHAQRFDHAAAQRCQGAAGLDQAFGRGGLAGVQADGACGRLGAVVVQPQCRARGVGQVLLVQQLECGLAGAQAGQQGVGAGAGQPCVQQFDDHVDAGLEPCHQRQARGVHVAWEPLNRHGQRLGAGQGGRPGFSRTRGAGHRP
jgi:hypothetical protein